MVEPAGFLLPGIHRPQTPMRADRQHNLKRSKAMAETMTTTLFRPVGPEKLELIRHSGFGAFGHAEGGS
jgi:hypothetical protein